MELAAWLEAIGTLLLAIVAVFQDRIRGLLSTPKLDAEVNLEPPDCHKTYFGSSSQEEGGVIAVPTYYFRIRVLNSGNRKAENVEVFAAELLRRQADGTFATVESFLPMNLTWSHIRKLFFPAISPDMYKHCDLAHIIKPNQRDRIPNETKQWPNVSTKDTILSIDTVVKSFSLSHLQPPGVYRIKLVFAAENAKRVDKTLEFSLTGNWYDDENEMFRDGVGLKVID